MLKEKIQNKEAGIITYGLTPPKKGNDPEKIQEIAQRQIERIRGIEIDGLIIYDIQDEEDRITEERPFPFLETVESTVYAKEYLKELNIPKIVYRCIGKYTEAQLGEWMLADPKEDKYSVFVGASSACQKVNLNLPDAYALCNKLQPNITLGGVLIPERHEKHKNEHMRIISKIKNGCSFFVSQAIYNVEASKNFLSDYYYYCQQNEVEMVPILFNLTPCGSEKTLDFMKWLGISVPRWLENDLKNSKDILDTSIHLAKKIYEELLEFGCSKGIPVGCSIESVSTRKVEIEASIQLAKDIKILIDKKRSINR